MTVGAGESYATIASALPNVHPGDVIEVRGDQTYQGTIHFRPEFGGEAGRPVTVRGLPTNGHLPVLKGVGTGQWDTMVVLLNANHFVFDGFEIVGGAGQEGIVHKADDVVVRNVIVHGAASQGLMGTDSDSGSLTLEYSEFYGNGNGMYSHQIYMATDETAYPGSVFRMQFCWVHDGAGGNNVKSRAERNEIYYNWIEGALYHELDLIGPDGQDPNLAREDSDVVGNVLIKSSEWRIARIGGDGTGNTAGRYRFVNNTMVLCPSSAVAIGLQETVETLEMYNNVVYGPPGGTYRVYNHAEASGATPALAGSNNWVVNGMQSVPAEWTNTVQGNSPGWVNSATHDLRPLSGSDLVDKGAPTTCMSGSHAFPSPLLLPASLPPARLRLAPSSAEARLVSGAIDIGAFESTSGTAGLGGTNADASVITGAGGSASPGASASLGGTSGTGTSGTGGNGLGALSKADAGTGDRPIDGGATPPEPPNSGCKCRISAAGAASPIGAGAPCATLLALLLWCRRRGGPFCRRVRQETIHGPRAPA